MTSFNQLRASNRQSYLKLGAIKNKPEIKTVPMTYLVPETVIVCAAADMRSGCHGVDRAWQRTRSPEHSVHDQSIFPTYRAQARSADPLENIRPHPSRWPHR